jgi:hypothetical protein
MYLIIDKLKRHTVVESKPTQKLRDARASHLVPPSSNGRENKDRQRETVISRIYKKE